MKKKILSKPGRKKTDDPKIMVPVWVNKSWVEEVGGMEAAKDYGYDGIRIAKNNINCDKALGIKK